MAPSQVSGNNKLSLVDVMLIEIDEALAGRSRCVRTHLCRPDPPIVRILPCGAIEETSPAYMEVDNTRNNDNHLTQEIIQELTTLLDGPPKPNEQKKTVNEQVSRSPPTATEKARGVDHTPIQWIMSPGSPTVTALPFTGRL